MSFLIFVSYFRFFMRSVFYIFLISLFFSCSSKKNLVYLGDISMNPTKLNEELLKNIIQPGDIIKIDVSSEIPEAAFPYNKISNSQMQAQNLDIIKLEGYLVSNSSTINFPVLGKLNVTGLSLFELENMISKLLFEGNHLANPSVKARRVNSKFTILGEVKNPGTFNYYDENLNVLQALGYAGDLTIDGKRSEITLIREENGLRKINKISLTSSKTLKSKYYLIKNNDIIIIHPNFRKVKSAGFIGSPSSIASVASLLLSITLLLINNP